MPIRTVTDPTKLHSLFHAMLSLERSSNDHALCQSVIDATCQLGQASYGVIVELTNGQPRHPNICGHGLDSSQLVALAGRMLPPGYVDDIEHGRVYASDSPPPILDRVPGLPPVSSYLVVPVRGANQYVYALIFLGGRADGHPFGGEDLGLIAAVAQCAGNFADQMVWQRRHELTALAAERERVARDMHDSVIHRLFGAGLSLQTVLTAEPHLEDGITPRIIKSVVEEIDATIMEIRTTIFELDDSSPYESSIEARLDSIIREMTTRLGVTVSARVGAEVDGKLDPEAAKTIVAALRELLANVARHSHATTVDIAVDLQGPDAVLTVTDNGVGLSDGDGTGRGLRNLRRRAEQHGGNLELLTPPGGGTRVRWSIRNGEML